MRLGDIILMCLIAGAFMTLVVMMTSDSEMLDFYDKNAPELNLSGRQTEMYGNDTAFYMWKESSLGIGQNYINKTDTTQSGIADATSSEIGLLSIPGVVLSALKTVFDIATMKWLNTAVASVETLFGLEPGTLGILVYLKYVALWTIILLVISVILRWLT